MTYLLLLLVVFAILLCGKQKVDEPQGWPNFHCWKLLLWHFAHEAKTQSWFLFSKDLSSVAASHFCCTMCGELECRGGIFPLCNLLSVTESCCCHTLQRKRQHGAGFCSPVFYLLLLLATYAVLCADSENVKEVFSLTVTYFLLLGVIAGILCTDS